MKTEYFDLKKKRSLVSGGASGIGQYIVENFCDQDELLEKIKKQGFVNTSYRNLNSGVVAIHSGWKI